MAYPNPPKTWSAAAVLTAAQLNAELRDALNTLVPTITNTSLGWASYTPTFTQSATITKTVNYAKYIQYGKLIIANVGITATSSGTANNAIVVGLPVTAASGAVGAIGAARITDFGVSNYPCLPIVASTTTLNFLDATQATTVFMGQTGAAFSGALGSSDSVVFVVAYEAA